MAIGQDQVRGGEGVHGLCVLKHSKARLMICEDVNNKRTWVPRMAIGKYQAFYRSKCGRLEWVYPAKKYSQSWLVPREEFYFNCLCVFLKTVFQSGRVGHRK